MGLSAQRAGSGEVERQEGAVAPAGDLRLAGWASGCDRGLRAAGYRQHRGARGAPGALEGRDKRADKPAEETS